MVVFYIIKLYSKPFFIHFAAAVEILKTILQLYSKLILFGGQMECSNCGFKNKKGAKFCAECGQPISEKKPKFCSECGRQVDAGVKFCDACGASLTTGPSEKKTKEDRNKAESPPAPVVIVHKKRSWLPWAILVVLLLLIGCGATLLLDVAETPAFAAPVVDPILDAIFALAPEQIDHARGWVNDRIGNPAQDRKAVPRPNFGEKKGEGCDDATFDRLQNVRISAQTKCDEGTGRCSIDVFPPDGLELEDTGFAICWGYEGQCSVHTVKDNESHWNITFKKKEGVNNVDYFVHQGECFLAIGGSDGWGNKAGGKMDNITFDLPVVAEDKVERGCCQELSVLSPEEIEKHLSFNVDCLGDNKFFFRTTSNGASFSPSGELFDENGNKAFDINCEYDSFFNRGMWCNTRLDGKEIPEGKLNFKGQYEAWNGDVCEIDETFNGPLAPLTKVSESCCGKYSTDNFITQPDGSVEFDIQCEDAPTLRNLGLIGGIFDEGRNRLSILDCSMLGVGENGFRCTSDALGASAQEYLMWRMAFQPMIGGTCMLGGEFGDPAGSSAGAARAGCAQDLYISTPEYLDNIFGGTDLWLTIFEDDWDTKPLWFKDDGYARYTAQISNARGSWGTNATCQFGFGGMHCTAKDIQNIYNGDLEIELSYTAPDGSACQITLPFTIDEKIAEINIPDEPCCEQVIFEESMMYGISTGQSYLGSGFFFFGCEPPLDQNYLSPAVFEDDNPLSGTLQDANGNSLAGDVSCGRASLNDFDIPYPMICSADFSKRVSGNVTLDGKYEVLDGTVCSFSTDFYMQPPETQPSSTGCGCDEIEVTRTDYIKPTVLRLLEIDVECAKGDWGMAEGECMPGETFVGADTDIFWTDLECCLNEEGLMHCESPGTVDQKMSKTKLVMGDETCSYETTFQSMYYAPSEGSETVKLSCDNCSPGHCCICEGVLDCYTSCDGCSVVN